MKETSEQHMSGDWQIWRCEKAQKGKQIPLPEKNISWAPISVLFAFIITDRKLSDSIGQSRCDV